MNEEAKQQITHERHMKKMWRAFYIIVAIAFVFTVFVWVKSIPPPNGKYDTFASCIASSGATFYGAWWCPHCQAQKAEFGDAVKNLPYIECFVPNSTSQQTPACIAKGIEHYPTWYFADGSSSTGELDLPTLSQKTNCPLPTSTN